MKDYSLKNGQGALYLIDHIGRPPKGVDFRSFTNQAIVDHLQQHSYRYERKNNTKDLALADPAWMRKYFGSLEDKVKKFDKSYTPDSRGRDPADRLFRKGTTKDFPNEVLTAFKYDKATFSESALPAYENVLNERSIDSGATKEVQDPIRSRGTPKVDEHKAAHSSRLRATKPSKTAAKPSKIAAKHASSPVVRNSDASFEITENEDEGETEDENDKDIGHEESNGDLNSNKDDGNNIDEHSTVRHPGKHSTESPDQTQVLTVGAKKSSSKLKLRQPNRVSIPRERSSGSIFASSTAEAGEANRANNDDQRLTAENQIGSQINVQFETVANAPVGVSRRKGQKPSGQSKRSSVPNNAIAELPQRQLGGNEGATQADSDTDELPINSKKRKASDAVGSLPNGRPKRRSHIPNASANVASPPSRSKPDVPAPIPSPITPRQERNDVQAALSDPKDPRSPQDGLNTLAVDHQHQHTAVNIPTSARNNKLCVRLERATGRIIASIGKISERLSPLAKNPSERLKALYVRCWGPDWKAVKSRLTEDNLFVVSEVVMSVIARFMFDKVLNQQTSLEDIEKMLLGVNGTMGRTVVQALKLKTNGMSSIDT